MCALVSLEKWPFHVADLPRTGKKCTKIKKAHEGSAKLLFLFLNYAKFVALSLPSRRRSLTPYWWIRKPKYWTELLRNPISLTWHSLSWFWRTENPLLIIKTLFFKYVKFMYFIIYLHLYPSSVRISSTRVWTWGLFLESPETFRAYFGWHNSLCIFKTKASRGTKLCSLSLIHIWRCRRS